MFAQIKVRNQASHATAAPGRSNKLAIGAVTAQADNMPQVLVGPAAHQPFFIEVMGRDAGFIALRTGIACGAEAILIPEVENQVAGLKDYLEKGNKRKKSSNIIIVAEGDKSGGAFKIAEKVKKTFQDYSVRVSVLGHIQRGGTPSAYDRVSASTLGYEAVQALLDDQKSVMVGFHNGEVDLVPFSKAIKLKKKVDPQHLIMADILSV